MIDLILVTLLIGLSVIFTGLAISFFRWKREDDYRKGWTENNKLDVII